MTSYCTLHNTDMTERTSKTKFAEDGSPKTYWAHNLADNSLCFGESAGKAARNGRAYTPAKTVPVKAEPDWDNIGRQKTRCELTMATIQHHGLDEALSSMSKIEALVSFSINGMPQTTAEEDEIDF